MSYEKDLEYLKRELRNAQNIYDEAEKDERVSDAEMWMNRATHLEFQIEVFEKATKSDEYEAKAKAFDAIMREWENERVTKSHILGTIQNYYKEYESGEYDAKK